MRILDARQVNEIARLGVFLDHWDSHPLKDSLSKSLSVASSEYGNINIGSQPKTATSLLVPRGNVRFYEYVEPGVKDLLAFFVEDMDLTTYTSCEGHQYRADLNQEHDERHVGIIVRTPEDRERIIDRLRQAEKVFESAYCDIAIMDHNLVCENTKIPALDIYLAKKPSVDWNYYFEDLDGSTARLVALLRSLNSTEGK